MTLTQSGGKKITDVKTYYCGYCVNHLHRMFKNAPKEMRRFYAAAVLFRYNGDYYLFDTGYSTRIFECDWRSKIYNRIIPTFCTKQDGLKQQLLSDGINLADIRGIILSHLHPDHVGGLIDFPDCKIFVSRNTYCILQKPKLLDLVFKELFPRDINGRVEVLDFSEEYDLMGDKSVILKNVSGHTHGQIGMLLPEHNTFYAADSAWGTDLLDKPMKFPARLLQKDYKEYQKTIKKIKQMQAAGINVITSHEVRK